MMLPDSVKKNLKNAVGYDESLLKSKGLRIGTDSKGEIVKDATSKALADICKFEFIWKK
jgi:hypothetical protein